MKTAVYAATDLAFDTKSERFVYPKGALVQLELAPDGDVFVVHHRLGEQENPETKEKQAVVNTTNLKFLRVEDLKFALEGLIFESQLSTNIDFRGVELEEALLTERIPPAYVARYLSDEVSPLEKSYTKENTEFVRIPVFVREKSLSPNEKIDLLREFDAAEDVDFTKFEDIRSVTARTGNNANDTGYMVSLEALTGNIDSFLPAWLEATLKASLPKDWKVRNFEGALRVQTNGDNLVHFQQVASTLPVQVEAKYNAEKEYHEVSIVSPQLDNIVESFFTKETVHEKYELIEGKGEEGDKCKSEDGKVGVLVKQGDSLVCMCKEAYTPDFTDAIQVGDPCMTESGLSGFITETAGGGLACMCKEWQTSTFTDYTVSEAEGDVEGGSCKKGDKTGRLVRDEKGKLVCQVAEQLEVEGFKIPKKEAQSYDGYPLSPGSSPAPNDDCDYQGKPGKLVLQNGALICALGGQKPKGAEGAN